MKYPINTTDDDLFYYPWHNGIIGYISFFDKEGMGKEDIYAIQPQADRPYDEVLADMINNEMLVTAKDMIAIPEQEKVVIAPEKTDTLMKPAETIQPEQVEAVEEKPVEKPQPVAEAEVAETQPAEKPQPAVEAERIVKEIALNPVYFAFDNFQLSETGKNELKKLAELLQTIPGSALKLFGYADAMGPAPYNLTLSEKRAISAMKFLISLGIEAGRLSAVGLGETNFAAINTNSDGTDNPEGRKLNRRVEFEVIGMDTDKLLIRRPIIPENLRYKGN
jgi:outer membrane protein OmpA-like peptidoglycan-associated protein